MGPDETNRHDVVPAELAAEIANAAGSVAADARRVGNNGPSGFYFSDDTVDWIEAVGNGESPEPPRRTPRTALRVALSGPSLT
jgi:hypothetical protein